MELVNVPCPWLFGRVFGSANNRHTMAVEMPDRLTKKQRELLEELKENSSIVRVDYWNIKDRERPARTAVLEVMKRELIRGEVVGQYTLIDDILSTELCKYFLSSKDMIKQWRTKKFK